MKSTLFDERTLNVNARVSQFALVLTQLGLLGIILFRTNFLNQPDNLNNDLRILLGLSVFGTMFATLLFGGMLPQIKFKNLVVIYLGFVALLFVILTIWLGLPDLSDWQNYILPVLLGPAILLGAYWFFAWLGAKRIDNQIKE
ncbi:MAG: hypothetical protein P8046_10840 [Anaerolineales bacterium]